LEQVFEGLAQQFDDHEDAVMVSITAEVIEAGDAGWLKEDVLMP
jgi:hypothetical protein